MRNWLKAFGIFAAMVAAPFIIERLLGRHPRLPGSDALEQSDYLAYGLFAVVLLAVLAAIAGAIFLYYQTEEISEQLTLAEREMTAQLRGWGGGLTPDTRKGWAEERGKWLQMIKDDKFEVGKAFFDLNQKDLESGGPQGAAMGNARMTAFLLRELYEGNVETAQLKVYNEFKLGKKPVIVAGLRQLLDCDHFDENEGFKRPGVDRNLLWLTVKMRGHPHHIVMVKTDADKNKFEVKNWDVLNELNRQTL